MAILSIHNLSKHYKGKTVLKDIHLTINKGEIVGLIGQNGAGKSTLMKIICDLVQPSFGSFTWSFDREFSPSSIPMTHIIENPDFFPYLSGFDILNYFAIQRGISSINSIKQTLKIIGLVSSQDIPYKNYSLGMKQRLAVGVALLGNPEVIILDEPTNGIDVQGLVDFRHIFTHLNEKDQTTLIISSHNLNELYTIANRFIFLKEGAIIQDISKDKLVQELNFTTIENYYLKLVNEEGNHEGIS